MLDRLKEILEPFDFPMVVLFGSAARAAENLQPDTPPHDVDLLVKLGDIAAEDFPERTDQLDEFAERVESELGLPCDIQAFYGKKPGDLVGLLAMRDGVLLRGARMEVTDLDIEEARDRLYVFLIDTLSRMRTEYASRSSDRFVRIPRSRTYQLESLEKAVKTLIRYETETVRNNALEEELLFAACEPVPEP